MNSKNKSVYLLDQAVAEGNCILVILTVCNGLALGTRLL